MAYLGQSILAATEAWWAGTPAMAALTASGKLFLSKAPENGDILPYATFFGVSEVNDAWTTSYPFKRTSVQFNLHAATAQQAEAMGLAVRNAFRGAPLVVGSSDVAHVLPDGTVPVAVGTGLGPGGRDCWVASETFDICWTP